MKNPQEVRISADAPFYTITAPPVAVILKHQRILRGAMQGDFVDGVLATYDAAKIYFAPQAHAEIEALSPEQILALLDEIGIAMSPALPSNVQES
ncbi:MAG TPA: hypothetical protein VFA43_10715 [Gemmatimonadaceae bacterium]|nr:hypothetical protein [Gemmatimonadaceae bacterium]